MSHTYIEILQGEDVIHRIDVTGRSERSIERVEDGVNINLATDCYTRICTYEEPKPLNP